MAITRATTSSVAQGPSTRKTVLGGNAVILPGSYDAIGTAVVGAGGQTTVTFTSIPQTYKHLQLRGIGRSTRAISGESAWLYFNNDTGTNSYSVHGISGNGSAASAYGIPTPNGGGVQGGLIPGSTATTDCFGGFVIDILDYTNTNKHTTTRSLTGQDLNGSGTMRLISSLWMNTAAVTSIKIDTQGGGDFVRYTQFDLYGIK
jgi:hypothetical protein